MTKKSEHYKEVIKYCKDITTGKILSGIYTRKAILRFLSDIKESEKDIFPYELIPNKADELIDFAESLVIPDIKLEDNKLKLLPWMKFIYYNLYGWRHKTDSAVRRFRAGYIEVARKNSKTTSILFPLILWDFIESNSAESYLVSKDEKQSQKTFEELKRIIKNNDDLKDEVNTTVNTITLSHSRIAFFSAESEGIDSYKNSLSVIDEFHAYPTDRIITAFKYGGRARENNLVLIITSAGNDISLPCYAENLRSKKVLNNVLTDDTYFSIIYSYDEGDRWDDPENFIKANPSLNAIIKKEILINDLKDAQSFPGHQSDFKAKTCGIWTNEKSSWISINQWQTNRKIEVDSEELIGLECAGGLDLSSVGDWTAYSLYFKYKEKYTPIHKFYIPSDTIQERYKIENINILEWIQNGLITVIEGSTIDYNFIKRDILNDYNRYKIKEIAHDPWLSKDLIDELNDEASSITFIPYNQNLKNFSGPTKQFEKAIKDGLIIDNNPILTWMLQNVLIQPDANNNYKPMKDYKASTQRIDGVITSIMAFDRLVNNENSFENRSLDSIYASWGF